MLCSPVSMLTGVECISHAWGLADFTPWGPLGVTGFLWYFSELVVPVRCNKWAAQR